MDISFEQREAIRCLYAYGCEGAIGPGGLILSSGGCGSATGHPILGTPETWLRLVSLGLATGHGPHRIRLTAKGEEEARRPSTPEGIQARAVTTYADGSQRVRTMGGVASLKRAVPIEDDIAAVRAALREAEATSDGRDGLIVTMRDTLDGLLAEQRSEAEAKAERRT